MKKLILIIFSFVFLSSNAISNDLSVAKFHEWLFENGHTEYINIEQKAVCKKMIQKHGLKVPKVGLVDEPKYKSMEWFSNKCHEFQATNNLKIKFYDGWIPEKNVKPNYGTLVYEFFRYNKKAFTVKPTTEIYEVEPSSSPYEFSSSLKDDKYLDKQLKKTALLSYLRFEDGQITVDKMSPKDRFGKFFNNETKLRGMSVGKTMTSYVAGHAICEGYIGSINSKLNDWPLIENTLYYDQEFINLLNMQAGDNKYVWSSDFLIPTNLYGADDHVHDIKDYMSEFKNSKKGKSGLPAVDAIPCSKYTSHVVFESRETTCSINSGK